MLDKAKSEGLQGPMASIDQTWVVTQDAKTFTVEASFSGGDQPRPPQKRTFNLDGSETTQDVTGRLSGKATLKAKWQGDGSILELNSVLKTNVQGNDITITTTEQLGACGRREDPQGSPDAGNPAWNAGNQTHLRQEVGQTAKEVIALLG